MAPSRSTPVLGVRDVRAAVAYYTDVLGFHCDPQTGVFDPANEGAVYGILDLDGAPLHLQIRRRDVFASPRESIESDVYFYVDDADAVAKKFDTRGVTFVRRIEDSSYGMRDFVIEDPDGHRLVFGSPNS